MNETKLLNGLSTKKMMTATSTPIKSLQEVVNSGSGSVTSSSDDLLSTHSSITPTNTNPSNGSSPSVSPTPSNLLPLDLSLKGQEQQAKGMKKEAMLSYMEERSSTQSGAGQFGLKSGAAAPATSQSHHQTQPSSQQTPGFMSSPASLSPLLAVLANFNCLKDNLNIQPQSSSSVKFPFNAGAYNNDNLSSQAYGLDNNKKQQHHHHQTHNVKMGSPSFPNTHSPNGVMNGNNGAFPSLADLLFKNIQSQPGQYLIRLESNSIYIFFLFF